jgi:hypothetical protein
VTGKTIIGQNGPDIAIELDGRCRREAGIRAGPQDEQNHQAIL